jgi:hypothetical protein
MDSEKGLEYEFHFKYVNNLVRRSLSEAIILKNMPSPTFPNCELLKLLTKHADHFAQMYNCQLYI